MIEAVLAVMLALIVASGVGYFLNSTSNNSKTTSTSSYCGQYVVSFNSFVQSSDNTLKTIYGDLAQICTGSVSAVPPSATDPFCPMTNAGLNTTGPAGDQLARRRSLLCGQYNGGPADPQRMRGVATWAQNLYINCGNSSGCGFGASGYLHNRINETPLVLNTDAQIQTFYDLLPQPWLFPAGGSVDESNPSPVRLEVSIRPLNIFQRNTTFDWGVGPTTFTNAYRVNDPNGYQVVIRPYFKKVARLPASTENPELGCQDIQMVVGFSRDNSSPTAITATPPWTAQLVNSGPNGTIDQANPAAATNADNPTLNAPTTIYYRDGTVRQAGAMCSCPSVAAGSYSGESCIGWDDIGIFARLNEPHAVPVAGAGVIAQPNQCASAVYPSEAQARDYTIANDETYMSVVWRGMPHSRLLSVGIRDSAGNLLVNATNPSTPQTIMILPGYCPAPSSYCADGSQTDVGVVATNAAACGATTNTYPGTVMNINCKPHDGCFGLCGSGTRAYNVPAGNQANCPATNTYCSVGFNRGPYACTPGIDCSTDVRCGDSVCDECGHDSCPNSTIPIGNTCPATTNYCAGAVVGGGGVWGRPTDTCGNACSVGTRVGVGCPNPAAVCIGTGTGVDDCGQACPAATMVCCVPSCADPASVCSGDSISDGCGGNCGGATGTMACGGPGGGAGGGAGGGCIPSGAQCSAYYDPNPECNGGVSFDNCGNCCNGVNGHHSGGNATCPGVDESDPKWTAGNWPHVWYEVCD